MLRRGQWVEECSFADAPKGPEGARVTTPPAENDPGNTGSVVVLVGDSDEANRVIHAQLGRSTSLLYLETALREAESHYENSEYDVALQQLTWLAKLVIIHRVFRSARECNLDYGLPCQALEPAQEFHAVRTKIFVLLRRLAASLDYYGNVANFVPLLGISFYSSVAGKMIEHARIVESAYIKYRDARDDWSVARAEIVRGLENQSIMLAVLQDRKDRVASIETLLLRDIESLGTAYHPAWRRVVGAGEDFKDAVRRKSGCEFKDVVTAVGTIAVAVSTAGTGLGVAMAAWKAYDQFDKEKEDPEDKLGDFAEDKYKIKKVVEIGEGIGGIAKGIGQISDLLKGPDRPDMPNFPSDAAKLLMSRKDLQATVDPFLHLPEAKKYLRIVDAFIELVTTRNNKVVEYNALANVRAEMLSDHAKTHSEIARLRTGVAQPNARHLPEFASFMGRANAQNKRVLKQMLYHEHRALEYWSGADYLFNVVSDSIDHLAQTHTDLFNAMVKGMEHSGRSPEKMTYADGVAKFSVKDDVGQFALEDFKASGKTVFSLPMARFDGLALVRFASVRVSIPGIKLMSTERGDDSVVLQLIHYGKAMLTTLENKILEFSHQPRSTQIFYHVSENVTRSFSLGGDGDTFIKLAANGPWSIAVVSSSYHRVDLSDVTDIVIDFEGEFFSLRTVAPLTLILKTIREK
jgi:hypothetical protein